MIKYFLNHTTLYKYSNPVVESTNRIFLYPYNINNYILKDNIQNENALEKYIESILEKRVKKKTKKKS